ncbi:hypothetical protein VNO77_34085 [Canavalia gladiata]|uniref:Uncharacterized protein n=1 Tax=Canavalia gladiata TaxID=3824 RepID=A0AAN9KGY9_CANGL
MAGTASLLRCRAVDMVGIQPLSSWVDQARKELDADHRASCDASSSLPVLSTCFPKRRNSRLPSLRSSRSITTPSYQPRYFWHGFKLVGETEWDLAMVLDELVRLGPCRPYVNTCKGLLDAPKFEASRGKRQSWDPLMAPLNGKEDHAYIDITNQKSNASLNWSGLNGGRLGLQICLLQLETRL